MKPFTTSIGIIGFFGAVQKKQTLLSGKLPVARCYEQAQCAEHLAITHIFDSFGIYFKQSKTEKFLQHFKEHQQKNITNSMPIFFLVVQQSQFL